MKKIICGLLIVCSLFAVVGCSSSNNATPTPVPTVKTPIQLLNESVAERFTSVWTQLNGKASNTDLSSLANRVGTLEGQTAPDVEQFEDDLDAIRTRITGLESLNISDTLSDIEAELAFLKLQLGNPTPTPTGTTPTPTPICSVTKPANPYPVDGASGISDNSIEFRWSDCGPTNYMLFVGVNSSTDLDMVYNGISTRYFYNDLSPDTYYSWKVVAFSPEGCPSQFSQWSFTTQ